MLRTKNRAPLEVGWREWVGLPELDIAQIKAKIDTGARTSALHAVDLMEFSQNDETWIEFTIPLPDRFAAHRCMCRVVDRRDIKNTSGVAERRYVVNTTLALGKRHWHIDLSLADREQMEFDLILGRTALRRHAVVVHPGKSFLMRPPAADTPVTASNPNIGLLRTLKVER